MSLVRVLLLIQKAYPIAYQITEWKYDIKPVEDKNWEDMTDYDFEYFETIHTNLENVTWPYCDQHEISCL